MVAVELWWSSGRVMALAAPGGGEGAGCEPVRRKAVRRRRSVGWRVSMMEDGVEGRGRRAEGAVAVEEFCGGALAVGEHRRRWRAGLGGEVSGSTTVGGRALVGRQRQSYGDGELLRWCAGFYSRGRL
ncbi:hypothetical protein E2562_008582 [Oryza meyeriana var. granulata]|uniref:Uncharacterized protein n=1 Tax=Oryza meyeriana var. granulata TaxID=110450 RepID=A0A6G1C5E6_9ORYZ|nr:hypothetical protein E2562_008582 [Oryza meyeriana var. granulata]